MPRQGDRIKNYSRAVSLGTGAVESDLDKHIIHFGTAAGPEGPAEKPRPGFRLDFANKENHVQEV